MRISDWSSDVCSSDLHMAIRRDRQCLHINRRIFPDLRIDQPSKGKGKGPLQQPLPRKMPMPVHRAGNFAMCHRCHKAHPRCRVVRCCLGQPKVGSVTLLLRPCETLAKSPLLWLTRDRKSVVSGKSVPDRVDNGGRLTITKTTN